uniref:Uncharacterized protein n=1 Tax=Anguilla anguilla TaxID=7936 RepID=A0A0E9SCA4_ANGAN
MEDPAVAHGRGFSAFLSFSLSFSVTLFQPP